MISEVHHSFGELLARRASPCSPLPPLCLPGAASAVLALSPSARRPVFVFFVETLVAVRISSVYSDIRMYVTEYANRVCMCVLRFIRSSY